MHQSTATDTVRKQIEPVLDGEHVAIFECPGASGFVNALQKIMDDKGRGLFMFQGHTQATDNEFLGDLQMDLDSKNLAFTPSQYFHALERGQAVLVDNFELLPQATQRMLYQLAAAMKEGKKEVEIDFGDKAPKQTLSLSPDSYLIVRNYGQLPAELAARFSFMTLDAPEK